MNHRIVSLSWVLLAMLIVSGCASLGGREPPNVTVAGVTPMEGQGFEMRMLMKLRVQNPNDSAIDYRGVSVKLDVAGKTLATGVSDASGTVPQFGESVIEVPITISGISMAKQALAALRGGVAKIPDKIDYSLTGKLGGSTMSAVHFKSAGTLDLPTAGMGQ